MFADVKGHMSLWYYCSLHQSCTSSKFTHANIHILSDLGEGNIEHHPTKRT